MAEWVQQNFMVLLILGIGVATILLPRINFRAIWDNLEVPDFTGDDEWCDPIDHFRQLRISLEAAGETEAVQVMDEKVWPRLANLVCKEHSHADTKD